MESLFVKVAVKPRQSNKKIYFGEKENIDKRKKEKKIEKERKVNIGHLIYR